MPDWFLVLTVVASFLLAMGLLAEETFYIFMKARADSGSSAEESAPTEGKVI